MCFNAPVCGLVVAAVGILLSVPMFLPPPPLSTRLTEWRNQGTFYNYNGHSIFYRDVTGAGNGGTLICLHGFPTFSWDWSKSVHSYSIFEQADIVSQLADHLSARDIHLLSHDYGDTVALELLSRHNQAADNKEMPSTAVPLLALRSLTMLNGGVFPETNKPRPLQKLLLIPVLGPFLSRLTFFSLFKLGFGEVFGDNKPTEDEFTDIYAAIRHHSGHCVTSSLLQYIPERQANRDRWVGALRNSRIPVLMIYGPNDPVNPPEFAELFRKEAPQHQLVVLEDIIGHYPQWEDPDSTLRHMQRFIQQLPSQSERSAD